LRNAVVATDSILPRKYAAGHCLQTMALASAIYEGIVIFAAIVFGNCHFPPFLPQNDLRLLISG
jgi:hypothetical protein